MPCVQYSTFCLVDDSCALEKSSIYEELIRLAESMPLRFPRLYRHEEVEDDDRIVQWIYTQNETH